jgi:predicted AAA+ superfamily ATPase
MIDLRTLEQILSDQAEELTVKERHNYCLRHEESLIDLDSPQAQVVIGIRRCGKSTLCYNALRHAGVNFAYVNFDDERLAMLNSDDLNNVLETLYNLSFASSTC